MVYVPPKYPNEIPTLADLPNRQDDKDWLYAARYNELKKELRAALIELGALPKGAYADVKARLDALSVLDKIFEGDSSVEVIDTNGDGHVDIKTENVLCGKYHSDGIHDLPKQSRCRAYKSAASQSIPPTTWTKVILDAENYDSQNEFDPTTNYRFTATKAGKYLVTVCMYYYPITDQKTYIGAIYKNGVITNYFCHAGSGTDAISAKGSGIVEMAVNDYLEMYTYHTVGVAQDILARSDLSSMSIHKLS